MNITSSKPNPEIKLTDEINTKLVVDIADKFRKWNAARSNIIKVNEKVEEQVYFNDAEKFDKHLPNLLETKDAYLAHYWNSAFKSPASTFSVNLPFRASDSQKNYSAIQKTALLIAHKKAKVQFSNLNLLEQWIVKGEWISLVTWEEQREWKREEEEKEILDKDGNISKIYSYKNKEYVRYKGIKVVQVEPDDFVFDVSKKQNFDSSKCAKIYRSWATAQDIIDNEIYKECLDAQKKEDIENLTANFSNKSFSDLEKDKEKAVVGDQIQVLEYWGDIKIDNVYYKNMVIAIAGGKHVIRFEENPWTIQPFVYRHYYEDPKTKRGYGPLTNILGLNIKASGIFEIMYEALKLILNPPWLTPKGSGFVGAVGGVIKIIAGKVLEYGSHTSLGKVQPPQQMNFRDALVGDNIVQFIEKKMESVTLNKYAAGDTGAMARTATEAGTILSGQNIKTALWVWVISEQIIIPTLQKIAFFAGNFMDEPEEIKINENGADDWQIITKEIRNAEYEYCIGNSSVILELKAKINELLNILSKLVELGLKLDAEKIFTNIICQAYELEDAKAFLQVDPLQEVLAQIPPEQRDSVKKMLADLVAQKMQEIQANGGNQQNLGGPQPQAMGI